jgi:hypothetical protein
VGGRVLRSEANTELFGHYFGYTVFPEGGGKVKRLLVEVQLDVLSGAGDEALTLGFAFF